MKQRIYITLVAAAALVLAGCGKKQPAERQKSVTVKTMKVAPARETVTRNYVGTIEEEEGVNVSFSNLGTVARVLVYEGQAVSKGQALAELDGRSIRNAYAMSKTTLDQAEDAYRRLKNLYRYANAFFRLRAVQSDCARWFPCQNDLSGWLEPPPVCWSESP